MLKKIAIFGAGFYGMNAYLRLRDYFDIVCFIDNNPALVGKYLYHIPICSGNMIHDICGDDTDIFVCSKNILK